MQEIEVYPSSKPSRWERTSNGFCEQSFQELKTYLQSAQLLSRPVAEDGLQLYLTVSESVLSNVLIREEEKVQRPMYYFSRQILESPSRSGRIVKWAIELSEFDLRYKPRTSIKAQALDDFLEECTLEAAGEELELVNLVEAAKQRLWLLYIDGNRNPGGFGAGILLWSPEGHKIEYALYSGFIVTNNEAEYEALANGISLANDLGAEYIHVRTDSQLMVGHVKGDFKERLVGYLRRVIGRPKFFIPATRSMSIRRGIRK
ncbi:hypothetical protein LIER_31783 [Lithospermum erythrorhizon]|uniref:RNase H type-1 domain-containing protein n=1 Tax=Lithospermum erythrorhizon TaxID=34254 RepID=A0AAV3RUD3_LITER